MRAEFRAEFFNAFNRTQFRHPNMRLGGGAFGQVTSQENEPRIIQIALKIHSDSVEDSLLTRAGFFPTRLGTFGESAKGRASRPALYFILVR